MRRIATVLLAAWAILVLPVWLLGMGFAGQILLVPDWKGNLDFSLKLAAMYLPPLVFAATRLVQHHRSRIHAQD